MKIRCIILICVVTLFTSCRENNDVSSILKEVDQLMEERGDSAFFILNTITKPEKLKGEEQAKYGLLFSKASIINGYRLTSDSLISIAHTYAVSVGDSAFMQQSAYWRGVVWLNLGDMNKAIGFFQEVIRYGEQQDKDIVRLTFQRLGYTFLGLKRYDEALASFFKVREYRDSLSQAGVVFSIRNVGQVYKGMGKLDEALACYEQIIDSIHSPYSKNLPVSMLLGEIRDLYIGKKDFKQALHYAQLAKENRLNRYEVPMHNLTLGKIYMYAHEVDSARSYLMRALQSPDHYVSTVAYKYLVALDVQMENYEEAYSTFQKSGDAFLNVQREIDYSIMSQQYKEEKLKNENNLLKLAKRDRELYLLWLSLFVVLACVVIYIFFSQERKKRMQKERLQKELLLKEEAKYLENENRLLKIESELSILREKESLLRESLFRRMTMATKIPSLDHSLKTEEELPDNKRIVLTEKEWEELILTVNDAYAGFAVRLREEYPVLTRKDIAFCCLVKIKVTMKDLSDIYCITKAGVSKKKTRMKKEKFGLSDDLLTLDLFLHHF